MSRWRGQRAGGAQRPQSIRGPGISNGAEGTPLPATSPSTAHPAGSPSRQAASQSCPQGLELGVRGPWPSQDPASQLTSPAPRLQVLRGGGLAPGSEPWSTSVSSLSMSSALSMTSFICSMNVSRSACRMKSCSTCSGTQPGLHAGTRGLCSSQTPVGRCSRGPGPGAQGCSQQEGPQLEQQPARCLVRAITCRSCRTQEGLTTGGTGSQVPEEHRGDRLANPGGLQSAGRTPTHHVGSNLVGRIPVEVELERDHLMVVRLQLALHHLVARVAHLRMQVVRAGRRPAPWPRPTRHTCPSHSGWSAGAGWPSPGGSACAWTGGGVSGQACLPAFPHQRRLRSCHSAPFQK